MWIGKRALELLLHQVATGEEQVEFLRKQLTYEQDKNSRLTEALLKKDTQVIVRLPDAPVVPVNIPVSLPPDMKITQPTEPANTWIPKGESWFGTPRIATPPVEKTVSAP